MATMAQHLADKDYRVVNLDDPSTQASIETLSRGIVAETVRHCRLDHPSAPIHFVTHSLGGILVRQYLQVHRLPPVSRVVMLSPPNQGSEIAELMKDFFLYRWHGAGGPRTGDDSGFPSPSPGPDRCAGGDHCRRQYPGTLVFLPGTGTG